MLTSSSSCLPVTCSGTHSNEAPSSSRKSASRDRSVARASRRCLLVVVVGGEEEEEEEDGVKEEEEDEEEDE